MPSQRIVGHLPYDPSVLIEGVTPGGTHYWYNTNDPDNAYLALDGSQKYPLSYIYGLATHTPTAATTQQTATGVEVQAAALGGKIAVIYGRDRVAPDVFFGPWSGGFSGNPGQLTVGLGLGEGEIDSLVQLETSPTGTASSMVNASPGASFTGFGGLGLFNFYAGVDAPAVADTYFTNVSTAYGSAFTERYPGLSFISAFLTFGAGLTSFPSFLATVKGRKLLDPRLGVDVNGLPNQPAVWSNNAMLVLVDYFISTYYGLGTPLAGINWASVATIATWCDQMFGTAITAASNTSPIQITSANHGLVTGGSITIGGVLGNTAANGEWFGNVIVIDANNFSLGGTTGNGAYTSGGIAGRKRFTINTTLRQEASHQANIDFLRAHFRCTYAKTNGLITFYVDAPAASVKVFDEADHAITYATNATPIVLTCPGHQRSTGDSVLVRGVTGNTAANGRWPVTVIDANTLSLTGSVGSGAYLSGGAIIGNCRALHRWRTPSASIPTKITYAWKDPSRDYQTATAVDITAAAQAGLVYTRIAPYNADGCRNAGQGQSQATYLLKKRGKDLNHSLICNRAEGLAMEMYDVCTLNLPSFGLFNYEARIVRITKFSNGEFQFDFEGYDSTIYPDVIAGTQTKVAVTLPDPSAVPPTPSAPVLTQDGLDIRVDFSPPAPAYPYYGGTLITVLKAGGTTYNLSAPLGSGPLYIRGVTIGTLYTVTAYTVSSVDPALMSAGVATTITPALPVAEWPLPRDYSHQLVQVSGNKPWLHFKPPQTRTRVLYANWTDSFSSIAGFNAARMNDGNVTLVAGTIDASDGFSVDLLTAKQIDEVLITVSSTTSVAWLSKVRVSSTGSFSGAGIGFDIEAQNLTASGGAVTQFRIRLAATGAFRYLQFVATASAFTAFDLREVQLYEYTGVDPNAVSTFVYDISNGFEALIANVPVALDIDTNPIDLSAYVRNETGGGGRVAIRLRAMNSALTLSDPFDTYVANTFLVAGSPLATQAGTEALANKALDSSNTVVTQAAGDNSTKPASTAFVAALIDDDTSLGGNSATRVPSQHAIKSYVDNAIAGLDWKTVVIAATTAAGTLATSFANGQAIDGVTLATGNRILIKNQASGSENGIYVVAASGAPTRATDADAGSELVSAAVFVESGTANADRAFVCTNDAITIGSTAITFTSFASVVGALLATNNLSDLANAGTARTNLGLGTLATQSGTFSGTSSGTNTGDQTVTLTGDVTGSGTGSFAATVAASAITLAKMANMATASLIYRKTAGSGAPEVNTLATLKTDLGLTGTNSGDQVISRNAPCVEQSFVLVITNTGGVTIQHQTLGSLAGGSAAQAAAIARITGLSNALANTPFLNSGVGFTSGGGIDNASQSHFLLNEATAANAGDDAWWNCSVVFNSTATAGVLAECLITNVNVNGTTKNRLSIRFVDASGTAWALSTGHIASAAIIAVKFEGPVR